MGSIVLCHGGSQLVPKVVVDLLQSVEDDVRAEVPAVPNSGAQAMIIGGEIFRRLGEDPNKLLHAGEDMLIVANGLSFFSIGRIDLQLRHHEVVVWTQAIVCPKHHGMLLSSYVSRDLGVLPKNYPKPILYVAPQAELVETACLPTLPKIDKSPSGLQKIREAILKESVDVFTASGLLKTIDGPPMKIELRDGAAPYAVNGARPIPFAYREEVRRMLEEMTGQGMIAPVTGHASRVTKWQREASLLRGLDETKSVRKETLTPIDGPKGRRGERRRACVHI